LDIGVFLNCDFNISPEDFLRFAIQDFQDKDKHGIINAITNAKRSIDCEVDKFLACIGYEPNADLPQNVKDYIRRYSVLRERVDIPQRLKLIRALGVAPSNIISEIRGIRHLLEHEYKLPTKTQVAEAIELATLFIGTVDNALKSFQDIYYISSEERTRDGYLPKNRLTIDFQEGHFGITGFVNHEEVGSIIISKTERPYLELLQLNIAVGVRRDIESALYNLLQAINCSIPQDMVKVKLM
jgi:hypothetical protein